MVSISLVISSQSGECDNDAFAFDARDVTAQMLHFCIETRPDHAVSFPS
jgi:hypothetical protein